METSATCKKLQDPNTHKGSKERYLFWQNTTANFRGNPLFQATKQHLNEMQDNSIPDKARRADVSKMLKENTSAE